MFIGYMLPLDDGWSYPCLSIDRYKADKYHGIPVDPKILRR
jgi:hypothetical protein